MADTLIDLHREGRISTELARAYRAEIEREFTSMLEEFEHDGARLIRAMAQRAAETKA